MGSIKTGSHIGCGGIVKDGCCEDCGADYIPRHKIFGTILKIVPKKRKH